MIASRIMDSSLVLLICENLWAAFCRICFHGMQHVVFYCPRSCSAGKFSMCKHLYDFSYAFMYNWHLYIYCGMRISVCRSGQWRSAGWVFCISDTELLASQVANDAHSWCSKALLHPWLPARLPSPYFSGSLTYPVNTTVNIARCSRRKLENSITTEKSFFNIEEASHNLT